MACLQLTVLVPVLKMTIFMSFLLSVKMGFCMRQTGNCRPFCAGSDCITVNRDGVDFKRAEEACGDRNGELMTFQLEKDEHILDILSQELYGNFWIGLHLPAGTCTNLSAPLRGYEWISGNMQSSFIPSFSTWKDRFKVCSPHCVSLSNDRTWTERLCSDKTDGYLCKTKHKDACQAQELSDENVFQSSNGCSVGPCEHVCTDVKGGYKCSCFRGYIPDSKDPRRCKMHCAQQKCPAICNRNTGGACFCPDGFLYSQTFCEDIDECLMNECDQECKNTFGSFVCSCQEGFVLKDQVKCIKAASNESFVSTSPVTIDFVKPTANNTTLKSSSAGGFFWLWIFVAVAVVVFIFVVRFYVVKHQKRIEQNSNQEFAAPVDNMEC